MRRRSSRATARAPVRALAPGFGLVLVLALAGCTGGPTDRASGAATTSDSSATSPSSPVTDTASGSPTTSSPTASGTPSESPSALPSTRLRAAPLHRAVLGRSAAGTAEEKAAVRTWMRFWQAATDTYFYSRPVPALAATSTGPARRDVLGYLRKLRSRQHRVVGWARDNVTSVRVTGDRAVIRDCTKNFTFSVDEEGAPATRPVPYYAVRGVLVKRQGAWKVRLADSRGRRASCLPR